MNPQPSTLKSSPIGSMLLLRYRVCRLTRRPSPETGSSLILLHWAVSSVSIVNLLMLEGSDASLFEWQCSLCRELRFRVLSPAQTCSRRGSYLCHDLPSLCTFIYPRIVPSVISHLHHKLVKSHLRRRAHWHTVLPSTLYPLHSTGQISPSQESALANRLWELIQRIVVNQNLCEVEDLANRLGDASQIIELAVENPHFLQAAHVL